MKNYHNENVTFSVGHYVVYVDYEGKEHDAIVATIGDDLLFLNFFAYDFEGWKPANTCYHKHPGPQKYYCPHCRRCIELPRRKNQKYDWESVDWKDSNAVIAAVLGADQNWVAQRRKALAPPEFRKSRRK